MAKQSISKTINLSLEDALKSSKDLTQQIIQLEEQVKKTKHGSYVLQAKIQSRKRERDIYINYLRSKFVLVIK